MNNFDTQPAVYFIAVIVRKSTTVARVTLHYGWTVKCSGIPHYGKRQTVGSNGDNTNQWMR